MNKLKKYLAGFIVLVMTFCFLFSACGRIDDAIDDVWIKAGGVPEDLVVTINASGNNLDDKLDWVEENLRSNTIYLIEVNKGEESSPRTLIYNGYTNITIHLKGISTPRAITLKSNGSLYTVDEKVTLILEDIVLKGHNTNNASLVTVNLGGTLVMRTGSAITDNKSNGYGGGVYVNNGSFIMDDGEISGNEVNTYNGGGVLVADGGSFIMNKGTIKNNKAPNGGGIYIDRAFFTMNGGNITGNTADNHGGGIFIKEGTFTKGIGGFIAGGGSWVDDNNAKYGLDEMAGHAAYAEILRYTLVRNEKVDIPVTLYCNSAGGYSEEGWEVSAVM